MVSRGYPGKARGSERNRIMTKRSNSRSVKTVIMAREGLIWIFLMRKKDFEISPIRSGMRLLSIIDMKIILTREKKEGFA